MKKQHDFHFLVLILAAMCLVCILGPVAFASIVEETYIPLPEPSLEGLGYVAISADPPLGFEGILCVEFQRKGSAQTDTIQISGLDYYAGGAWLKEGTYLVKDTYVLDSDHFSVTNAQCRGNRCLSGAGCFSFSHHYRRRGAGSPPGTAGRNLCTGFRADLRH